MMGRTRRCATAAVIVAAALFLAPMASATQPAPGKWSGTSGPKLTFSVAGAKMTNFIAPSLGVQCYPVYGSPYSTTVTFYVPSIAVKSDGSFDTTYEQTDSSGQPDGQLRVNGKFTSPTSVSGTMHYLRFGCSTNVVFTAKASGAGAIGHTTPKPKPVVFKPHCKKRSGKRVCKNAKPVRNRTYSGKTSQGQPLKAEVNRSGNVIFTSKGLKFTCADGYSDTEDVAIGASDHQRVSKRGSFYIQINYSPGGGWSHEVIYVAGAFDGHKAKGKLVGNTQIAGHGKCTTGAVSWSATG